MNLIKYIILKVSKPFRNFVHPENINCWLKCETHDWNDGEGFQYCEENTCTKCGRYVNDINYGV